MLMGILIGLIVVAAVLVYLGQRGPGGLPWVPGKERRQRQLDADVNRGIEKRDTSMQQGRDLDGSGFPDGFGS
jgi:hypothetical protein